MSDVPQTTPHEAPLEQVWRVCAYLRRAEGQKCKQCPRTIEIENHGPGKRMCVGLAEEIINVVETGSPWRDGRTLPAPILASARNAQPSGDSSDAGS